MYYTSRHFVQHWICIHIMLNQGLFLLGDNTRKKEWNVSILCFQMIMCSNVFAMYFMYYLEWSPNAACVYLYCIRQMFHSYRLEIIILIFLCFWFVCSLYLVMDTLDLWQSWMLIQVSYMHIIPYKSSNNLSNLVSILSTWEVLKLA